MNRYRMTSPSGHSATCDMNAAAARHFTETLCPVGWVLELLGPSLITVVEEAQ